MCIYLQQQLTFLKKDIFRKVVFLLIMNYHSAPSFWAFPAHKYEENAVAQGHAKLSYNHWKLVLKKHLEVILCTKLFISKTNMTWEPLCVCVCVFEGQGGDLPGNMLGEGNIQMKKKFLSSWINKYYPERLIGLAEVICLVAKLWNILIPHNTHPSPSLQGLFIYPCNSKEMNNFFPHVPTEYHWIIPIHLCRSMNPPGSLWTLL